MEGNDILQWVNDIKAVVGEKYSKPKHTLIFLFVTSGIIPPRQKDEIRHTKDYILYVDRTNLEEYAPTNLYPFLMTPEGDELTLLKFIEKNQLQKTATRNLTATMDDMKEILNYLKVVWESLKPKPKFRNDFLALTLQKIKEHETSSTNISSSLDINNMN